MYVHLVLTQQKASDGQLGQYENQEIEGRSKKSIADQDEISKFKDISVRDAAFSNVERLVPRNQDFEDEEQQINPREKYDGFSDGLLYFLTALDLTKRQNVIDLPIILDKWG